LSPSQFPSSVAIKDDPSSHNDNWFAERQTS
jgi:hypothetical protein